MNKNEIQLFLDRIHFALTKSFSEHDLECLKRTTVNFSAAVGCSDVVFFMDSFIHGIPDHKIKIDRRFPRTWWDHFKHRWFPKRLKRKFPVDYERIYVDQIIYKAVCPHLHDDGQDKHVKWLVQQEKPDPELYIRVTLEQAREIASELNEMLEEPILDCDYSIYVELPTTSHEETAVYLTIEIGEPDNE